MCAEEISAAAKICPHCRSWQTWHTLQRTEVQVAAFGVVLLAIAAGMGALFDEMLDRGEDFAPYRENIRVLDSSIAFSTSDKGLVVSVVGMLTNESDLPWREVLVEVQHFDGNRNLIDSHAQMLYSAYLSPHGGCTFRVRGPADQPREAYVSHVALVRTAKDARSRW